VLLDVTTLAQELADILIVIHLFDLKQVMVKDLLDMTALAQECLDLTVLFFEVGDM